ncbi:MAG: DUF1674 domain-containing protein [Alphaproteobacteria bacterium]
MPIKTTGDRQRAGEKATPPGESADGCVEPRTLDVEEIGGSKGPDPTRYGDWQHKGRVSDF